MSSNSHRTDFVLISNSVRTAELEKLRKFHIFIADLLQKLEMFAKLLIIAKFYKINIKLNCEILQIKNLQIFANLDTNCLLKF